MDSIHLRIRIDRAIAEQAMKMAQARGMELPDAIRMMVTKAVQIGDFSIEQERSQQQEAAKAARPYYAYDERQWNSMKSVLDAELALALLNQYIASHSLQIEAMTDRGEPDIAVVEQFTQERDEARKMLATLDPTDTKAVQAILERLGPPTEPPEPTEPNGKYEGSSQ